MRSLFYSRTAPLLFGYFLLLLPFSLFAQNIELRQLLEKRDYFRFHKLFEDHKFELNDRDHYYFSAYNESWFGSESTSNDYIKILRDSFEFSLGDSAMAQLRMLRFNNCLRTFQYKEADREVTTLLFRYPNVLSSTDLEAIKNGGKVTSALANIPEQSFTRHGDLDIPFKRDLANLIRIAIKINGEKGNFVFDTGANLSTITESEAKHMHVRIVEADFGITSSSQTSLGAHLGIADELVIGSVTFHHVIFIVLPDKALRFAGGIYKIKGIIGLPVIAQLGEVIIDKKGRLLSPLQQSESSLLNLGFDGNVAFVNAEFYGEEHPYIFDTGAAATVFSLNFKNNYSGYLRNAEETSSHVGGAGGIQKVSNLVLRDIAYEFGGRSGKLKRATVQTIGALSAFDDYFGIVGEDIFTQYDRMVMNFDKHFVRCE